jgi:SAM-dependent methyltransferase
VLRARRREPPLPPVEMRELVGLVDPVAYALAPGETRPFSHLPDSAYRHVLDFGCGCGRIARQLMLGRPRPRRYLGLDLHRGLIEWCQANMAPAARGFRFQHHDVHNRAFNPKGKSATRPFPVGDGWATLVIAHSVFTHLLPEQADHYLREVARVLAPDGWLEVTFFLFDKREFPMMQDFQNALYINEQDPTNAVIYDRGWLRRTLGELGLVLVRAEPPVVRGFQWQLSVRRAGAGSPAIELPEDAAPAGRRPPPLTPAAADRIGL